MGCLTISVHQYKTHDATRFTRRSPLQRSRRAPLPGTTSGSAMTCAERDVLYPSCAASTSGSLDGSEADAACPRSRARVFLVGTVSLGVALSVVLVVICECHVIRRDAGFSHR